MQRRPIPISTDVRKWMASSHHPNRKHNRNSIPLVLTSSSSRLLTRTFPRYTRFVRRFVRRFGYMHRLALVALLISVVLAFTLSIASRMSSPASSDHSDYHHQQHLSHLSTTPSQMQSPFPSFRHESYHHDHHDHHDRHHRHLRSDSTHTHTIQSSVTTSQRESQTPTTSSSSIHVHTPVHTTTVIPATSTFNAPHQNPKIKDRSSSSHTASSNDKESYATHTATVTVIGTQVPVGYHFEDDLIKTQAVLEKLPSTTWHYSYALDRFQPMFASSSSSAPRSSHISKAKGAHPKTHLITLNNACYCTNRNQFIVVNSKHHHHGDSTAPSKKRSRLPTFMFRHGVALAVASSSPRDVLFTTGQKAVFLPGITVLWRGRSLLPPDANLSISHITQLHRMLLPLRSIVDLLQLRTSASKDDDVYVATENFDVRVNDMHASTTDSNAATAASKRMASTLINYYLGDVPVHRRLSLQRLRPRLVCFRRVVSLGSEYEGSADHMAHNRIKDLVEQKEGLPKHTLVRHCAEREANRGNVWIIHHQGSSDKQAEKKQREGQGGQTLDEQTPRAGTLHNVAQVETAVNHELLRYERRVLSRSFHHGGSAQWSKHESSSSGSRENDDGSSQLKFQLTQTFTARVIQAPTVPCPLGSAREGCFDTDCTRNLNEDSSKSSGHDACASEVDLLKLVRMYNNMTLLITTSGRANHGFAFMPQGAHVIEVVPYGVLEPSYEQAAKAAGLSYHRVQSKLSTRAQQSLFQRFGDVANSPITCWGDPECRAARLDTETVVDVKHLAIVLRAILPKWEESCVEGSTHYRHDGMER